MIFGGPRGWLVAVLLVACYRHNPAILREAQLLRAQDSSVDCGDASPHESTQSVHDCMVGAFQERQPFHGRLWKQGIDSNVASGLALDPSGNLFLYRFDTSPCGAPGRCRPSLEEIICARPYVRKDATGEQLACAHPSFNDSPPRETTPRAATQNITAASAAVPMRVGGDVEPPRAIHRVEPRYDECKNISLSGTPVLEAVIDVDGRVRDIHLIRPIHPCLDQNIVEAVKQWRFEPGTLHGKPVPTILNITVHINFK
jgi:TonB family protein